MISAHTKFIWWITELDVEVLIRNKETKNRGTWIAPYGIAAVMVGFVSPLLVRMLNDPYDKQFIKWFGS
jgi:hypothetical protein